MVGSVPAHPPTSPVEQPIDLLFIRPAYTTFLHVRIMARPIDSLVNSLFNRPQGEKYVMRPSGVVSEARMHCPARPHNIQILTDSPTKKAVISEDSL
jgi:hypothetical protein